MSWVDGLRARWRFLVHRRAAESRIDQEFDFHIDMEAERLVRDERLAPDEARRRALARFGGVIGVVGAAAPNRYTGGQLLEGHHAIVLPVVLLLMTLNGLVAALGPARRGLRIPPAEALKAE